MSGLGGLNKSPNGVVIGLVQLQLPVVATPADLGAQAARIAALVGKARRSMATMDLVVFPEYSLHGLSMDTNPAIMCRLDGPEVRLSRQACRANTHLGLLLDHGAQPATAIPTTAASSSTIRASCRLYYRKLHPWVPVEPWEPGNLGIPVCDGPERQQARADHLPRRHVPRDGARVRLQGRRDHAPHRRLHRADPPRLAHHQPGQRVLQPDVHGLVCMCGSDGTFDSMGEGMIVNFDGVPLATRRRAPRRDHHRRGAARSRARGAARLGRREQHLPVRPSRLRRGARAARAIAPTRYMTDLAAGKYRLPWEDEVRCTRRHLVRLCRADARLRRFCRRSGLGL